MIDFQNITGINILNSPTKYFFLYFKEITFQLLAKKDSVIAVFLWILQKCFRTVTLQNTSSPNDFLK